MHDLVVNCVFIDIDAKNGYTPIFQLDLRKIFVKMRALRSSLRSTWRSTNKLLKNVREKRRKERAVMPDIGMS